jgi:hypothetical protein
MKVQDTLVIAIGLAAVYLIWKSKEQIEKGTGAVTTWIADAWITFDSLLPGQGGIQLLGNVVFPNNAKIPIGQLTLKTDRSTGKVYTTYGGAFYQLQASNSSGDWPAVRVQ